MRLIILLLLCSILGTSYFTGAETCPGGVVRCPNFMTCCELAGGSYGCCPFPHAKCCVDHIHCCPNNMECDVARQACVQNGSPFSFNWKVPISPEAAIPVVESTSEQNEMESNKILQNIGQDNKCPDDSVCNSKFTCCKMFSGKYGCCPFENATCCQNGFNCCPQGTRCRSNGSCYSPDLGYLLNAYFMKDNKLEKHMKTEPKQEPSHHEVSDPGGKCPDGHPCPEKYTCCKIQGSRYGCCPYSEARCCDDGIHCCPKGTNCNITLGTCDIQKTMGFSFPSQSLVSLKWSDDAIEESFQQVTTEVSDVVCPDERYHCPSGSTCCELASGDWGCCPIEEATCCKDHEHCCPHGYSCVKGGCQRGNVILQPFPRTPALSMQQTVKETNSENEMDVVCPDGFACPPHNTCCQLESGDYGCCPMEEATCCPDKLHCCPHGFSCVEGGCQKESGFSRILPTFVKASELKRNQEVTKPIKVIDGSEATAPIVCPDKISLCPEGATCCQLATGTYGCCPYEKATCCGDQESCCPHGYWCTDDGCERVTGMPSHYAPFLVKLSSAKKIYTNYNSIPTVKLMP